MVEVGAAGRTQLGHEEDHEPLFGIDDVFRKVGAAPAVGADGADLAGFAEVGADPEAEAEAVAFAEEFIASVVGVHELDGFRGEEADAVEFASVEEHLEKAGVVACGGEKAGAAGEAFAGPVDEVAGGGGFSEDELVVFEAVDVGEARGFFRREEEVGVAHVERAGDAFLDELVEGFFGDDFDETAEDIGGVSILKLLAGVAMERKRGEAIDDLSEGFVFAEDVPVGEAGLFVGVVRETVAVGEAGGVAEEVADGDGALRFFGDVFHALWGALRSGDGDDGVFEGGKVFGDGVVEAEFPFLVEHHHGDGGDGLGHRCDAEDGVGAHGLVVFDVLKAVGFEDDGATVAGNIHDAASEAVAGDLVLDGGIQTLEALGGEAGGGDGGGV